MSPPMRENTSAKSVGGREYSAANKPQPIFNRKKSAATCFTGHDVLFFPAPGSSFGWKIEATPNRLYVSISTPSVMNVIAIGDRLVV